ncbi:MAG TPA: lipid-binding SYLF domain-containing protein [Terracidiphilus sp.]|nr:lipid-binding SYLF domain-containing protein [Terracidiphilus sp.]
MSNAAHWQRNEVVPMKRWMFLLAILCCESRCWAASERQDAVNRLDRAARVMHEIMNSPDKRIPDRIMKRARCVAVVPHLIKGGFVFGAEEGKGVATCRTGRGWSAPAFIQMGGGNWGTQIGAEAVDLVMVIKGAEGMQKLLSSKFEIGRDASVAVGPMGRHSSENTDVEFNTLILTYSRAKGAFLGMTFDGALVRQDNGSRRAIYGPRVTTRALLLGRVAPPRAARPFLSAVRGARAQAAFQSARR